MPKAWQKRDLPWLRLIFAVADFLSKSDGKLIDMSIDTEKQDLLCVIDYVSSLGYVDVSKLILIGESHTV